jgi:hypothetical protein
LAGRNNPGKQYHTAFRKIGGVFLFQLRIGDLLSPPRFFIAVSFASFRFLSNQGFLMRRSRGETMWLFKIFIDFVTM